MYERLFFPDCKLQLTLESKAEGARRGSSVLPFTDEGLKGAADDFRFSHYDYPYKIMYNV